MSDRIDLKSYSDEEIQLILETISLEVLLEPIKHDNKHYIQYTSQLGRMTAKSQLVKKNLRSVALRLYRTYDHTFVEIIETRAVDIRDKLLEGIKEAKGKEYTPREIEEFTATDYLEVLKAFNEAEEGNEVALDLFWFQLKLNGISIDEVTKSIITSEWNKYMGIKPEKTEVEKDNEEGIESTEKGDLIENETEKKTRQRSKVKKLTPEEKAAKTKAANEKKQLEKKLKSEGESEEIVSEEAEDKSDTDDEQKRTIEDNVTERQNSRGKTDMDKTEKLNIYVGEIKIRNEFYNLNPIGVIEDDVYRAYTEKELDKLLPQSQKQNINLYYNKWDEQQEDFMNHHLYDDMLVFFEIEENELQENRKEDGTLNPTGYKIPAIDTFRSKKIHFPSEYGFYPICPVEDLVEDISNARIIHIHSERMYIEGEKILVRLDDGFIVGPLEVRYDITHRNYYVVTQNQANRYFVSGYYFEDLEKVAFDKADWNALSTILYKVKNPEEVRHKDFVTDKLLMESFKNSLSEKDKETVKLSDIDGLISRSEESLLTGAGVPEDLRSDRQERIISILKSETDIDRLSEESISLISELLISKKDDSSTEKLINRLLEDRPDFAEKIQSVRIIQDRIKNARAELEEIEEKKNAFDEEGRLTDPGKTEKMANDLDIVLKQKIEEINKAAETLGVVADIEGFDKHKKSLEEEVKYLENHKSHLMNDTKNLETDFVDLINKSSGRIVDIAFDGFMSSKMLKAASQWEEEEEKKNYEELVLKANADTPSELTEEELIEYLVDMIQVPRPQYDRNVIVNIMTCISQGFLTVFSGAPGCGKTSICNILAKVLGMVQTTDDDFSGAGNKWENRYIPVSVERGWTSKRDLIGYYNPLTKAFEESNREVYDALRILNEESLRGLNKYPYFILLDEANLSPMEYYWADFMNVCDDLRDNHSINLGNNNIFSIPETLHFLATINNDHTTETLSPRLIDRAWIITLPKFKNVVLTRDIEITDTQRISWKSLYRTFVRNDDDSVMEKESQRVYDGIREICGKVNMNISPRVDIAIHRYCNAASKYMVEDEYNNNPGIIALDYAVMQKVLPKIVGSGEDYEHWLVELEKYCQNSNLLRSSDIVRSIIETGNRQMKYFQFFS